MSCSVVAVGSRIETWMRSPMKPGAMKEAARKRRPAIVTSPVCSGSATAPGRAIVEAITRPLRRTIVSIRVVRVTRRA